MLTLPIISILAIITAGFIHEFGHWIVAKLFGFTLKFRFKFGKFYVPRFIWDMPETTNFKQRSIAVAGFLSEIGAACIGIIFIPSIFTIIYCIVTILHFLIYKFYAGDISDFNWF